MKPKLIMVLEMCIENGLVAGYNRAHKHDDDPDPFKIQNAQFEAIITEIHEWFDFPVEW